MFKLVPNPTFVGVVKVPVPGAKPADLKLIFKHKKRDEVANFFKRAASSDAKDEIMLEIVDGWQEVDAEFSPEALRELLQNYHGAIQSIFDTYLSELSQARKGN